MHVHKHTKVYCMLNSKKITCPLKWYLRFSWHKPVSFLPSKLTLASSSQGAAASFLSWQKRKYFIVPCWISTVSSFSLVSPDTDHSPIHSELGSFLQRSWFHLYVVAVGAQGRGIQHDRHPKGSDPVVVDSILWFFEGEQLLLSRQICKNDTHCVL